MPVSQLWVSAQLVKSSDFFAQMVQAAAWSVGKTYTFDMLCYVARDPALVSALSNAWADSIGATLETFIKTNGSTIDNLISTAVATYTPPENPATS